MLCHNFFGGHMMFMSSNMLFISCSYHLNIGLPFFSFAFSNQFLNFSTFCTIHVIRASIIPSVSLSVAVCLCVYVFLVLFYTSTDNNCAHLSQVLFFGPGPRRPISDVVSEGHFLLQSNCCTTSGRTLHEWSGQFPTPFIHNT